jgi:hypothetical protein
VISRKRAWILSTAIAVMLVMAVLLYGTETAQLGFDDDDSIIAAAQTEGWT